MNISAKSQDMLVQQAKDFFVYCNEDSYIYTRVYSAKKLMRALEHPYARDIVGQSKILFDKIMHSDILHGKKRQLNFHDTAKVIEAVSQELTEQVLTISGAKSQKNIDALSMRKITEEYLTFLRDQRKEEVVIGTRGNKNNQIVINPYQYVHNTH